MQTERPSPGAEAPTGKVIYDIGANNGDDLAYYLLKAERVVAVEANPRLCEQILKRFQKEVELKRLIIENCALTDSFSGEIDFYIHRVDHILSTLVEPVGRERDHFERTRITAISVSDLVAKHGEPYYIKIDIEGYDEKILEALYANGIKPPYISAESHTLGVFSLLAEKFGYKSFKLLEGASVGTKYAQAKVFSPIAGGYAEYSFPSHSAGPFGDDIDGDWLDKDSLLKLLGFHGLGWKDIHATDCTAPKSMRLVPYNLAFARYMSTMVADSLWQKLRQGLRGRSTDAGSVQ